MRWGFGHGEGAAVHMYGRYARLTMAPNDASRTQLLELADWVDEVAVDKDLPLGVGVENFPDAEVFGSTDAVPVTVSIGYRLNTVHEGQGMVKVAGMVDAYRERVRAVGTSFWTEAAERLGATLGTVAKPTSVIGPDNPLRSKDELLLVHASDGLGCRYAVGVEARRRPDMSGGPRSVKGMRRGFEDGVAGYHLWVETTTQLSIRDAHRRKMAEATRAWGPCFSWMRSVAH